MTRTGFVWNKAFKHSGWKWIHECDETTWHVWGWEGRLRRGGKHTNCATVQGANCVCVANEERQKTQAESIKHRKRENKSEQVKRGKSKLIYCTEFLQSGLEGENAVQWTGAHILHVSSNFVFNSFMCNTIFSAHEQPCHCLSIKTNRCNLIKTRITQTMAKTFAKDRKSSRMFKDLSSPDTIQMVSTSCFPAIKGC